MGGHFPQKSNDDRLPWLLSPSFFYAPKIGILFANLTNLTNTNLNISLPLPQVILIYIKERNSWQESKALVLPFNTSREPFSESTAGKHQLMCDVSSGRWRPLVPLTWRRRVFLAVHNLAHPGIRASRRLISARFMWKGMAADVGQ